MGERDAVLVDPPFTKADAHRVAAMVLDSGKRLTHISSPTTIPTTSSRWTCSRKPSPTPRSSRTRPWWPTSGARCRSRCGAGARCSAPMARAFPGAPRALTGDTIMLEGHELKVIGPMQGDHVHSTALWAPGIKALFPGDIVFNEMHLWFGEHGPDEIAAWDRALANWLRSIPRSSLPVTTSPACPTTRAGSSSAAATSPPGPVWSPPRAIPRTCKPRARRLPRRDRRARRLPAGQLERSRHGRAAALGRIAGNLLTIDRQPGRTYGLNR